jgi:hypothetical protein
VFFGGEVLRRRNIFGAEFAAFPSRLRPFWDAAIHGRVNAKKILRCDSSWCRVCITGFS